MEELLRIARRPAVTTTPGATVLELCHQMVAQKVGAVAVLDGTRLVGIVSERDVVAKVVVNRGDAERTLVGAIMTKDPRVADDGMTIEVALEIMRVGHFRHLPLVDRDGLLLGMLSMRHLLNQRCSELDLRNADLVNFIAADGPGG